jgi:hypothetical protein
MQFIWLPSILHLFYRSFNHLGMGNDQREEVIIVMVEGTPRSWVGGLKLEIVSEGLKVVIKAHIAF